MDLSFFQIAYFISLIFASLVRVSYTRRFENIRFREDRKSGKDMFLVALPGTGMFILPVVYVFTPWLDFANYKIPVWMGWIGVFLFLMAIILLWRSHVDLGNYWSPSLQIQENHNLIKTGSYKYVRHPMYAAHWLWAIAQILLLHNWIAGCSMIITFLPGYLYRVKHEEQMMIDIFGDEYREYMNQTGRLIPKLK